MKIDIDYIKKLFSHIIFIFAGFFIVLIVLDIYNPTNGFVDNAVSCGAMLVFCILCMVFSVLTCVNRK